MAVSRLLSSTLQQPLLLKDKNEIFRCFWSNDDLSRRLNESPTCGDSYFRYYREQCAAISQDPHEILSISTHQHVLDVMGLLQEPEAHKEFIKDNIIRKLSSSPPAGYEERVLKAINFVVRLCLMLDVGEYMSGSFLGQTQLLWGDESIRDLIRSQFNKTHESESKVNIEKKFNAYNIEKVAGIKIFWTNNLADHLRMMNDDSKVAVFHHAFFLQCHKTCQMFPLEFIEETLRTLALLLPQHDAKTKAWFEKYQKKHHLDSQANQCGQLKLEDRNIEKFPFWHDRLLILKEAFDETEPNAFRQLVFDRRKRVQWYTFWIAALVLLLTIFFGIVQSIEGGIQAYAALHPSH